MNEAVHNYTNTVHWWHVYMYCIYNGFASFSNLIFSKLSSKFWTKLFQTKKCYCGNFRPHVFCIISYNVKHVHTVYRPFQNNIFCNFFSLHSRDTMFHLFSKTLLAKWNLVFRFCNKLIMLIKCLTRTKSYMVIVEINLAVNFQNEN